MARFIIAKDIFVRVCMVRYFQNNCEDANSLLVEIYFPTSRINEVWLRANDILIDFRRINQVSKAYKTNGGRKTRQKDWVSMKINRYIRKLGLSIKHEPVRNRAFENRKSRILCPLARHLRIQTVIRS